MSAEVLQKAFASTAAVLAQVKPDHMEEATPSASWTVRELVNHIVGGTIYFATIAETGEAPTVGETPDFASGAFVATFDQGAQRAVTAFSAEGVMDKVLRLPFGERTGSQFVLFAAIDTFTHGWDLAKAIGQPTDLDPAVSAQLLGVAQASLSDSFRGPDGQAPFGHQFEVPESSCPADQLAGFMGRRP